MSKIRVALRVRPLSERECNGGFPVVVAVERNFAYITDIKVPEKPSADSRQRFRHFEFDHGFWLTDGGNDGASQQQVYQEMGPPLEKSILEGYNACLLAYGQSGTGKTHTMLGNKHDPGLIPRLCQSLWEKLKEKQNGSNGCKRSSFRMEVSFMEIYREKVRDLLSPDKPLKLREHPQLGPHVQDLTRVEVNEEMGLLDLLWEGERRRAIGTTGSNHRSSRSHAIWTLYLTTRKNSPANSSHTDLITNQVHLVDLAGSERAEFTTTKNLLAEGADINRSLVSLGNVISALAEKAQYIPYRDSALTWLLKDSLGGNATTAIIITASPASCCHAQTLNSLRFAQRARLVENQPKVNGSVSISGALPMMSAFDIKKDISRLANIIRTAQSNGGILRGLAPRHGWNRLISAIEGLNQNHPQQQQQQPTISENVEEENKPTKLHRAASEDATTNTSCSPINVSSKSLTDVMVQADIQSEGSCSSRHCTASASVPASPSKIISTEVFIPHSNSIKCLTWKQEEARLVQKPQSHPSDSDDEYLSPPLTPKINHLRYLFPVHYPQTHNLDRASRISEKIHRSFSLEEPEILQLFPVEITDQCGRNYPLVRERLPTLVKDDELADISESSLNYSSQELRTVPVFCKGVSRFDSCVSQPTAVEFYHMHRKNITPLESTDEDEVFLRERQQDPRKMFRGGQYKNSRLVLESLTSPDEPALFFTSESILTSSTPSLSSSSSYDSFKAANLRKVRVVQEASSCEFVEDVISEIIEEDPVFENHIATIYNVEDSLDDEKTTVEIEESVVYKKPLDGFSSSKFRNYFARELYQMDKIGRQIRNLQQISDRYKIVKPYLEQIAELDNGDHSQPDLKIDEEIERCSGWNIDIEFQKVTTELSSINKILKTGVVPLHSATSKADEYPSSTSNSRTSTTLSSDSMSGGRRGRRESLASSKMFEPKIPSHLLQQNNLNLTSHSYSHNAHISLNPFHPPTINCKKSSNRLPPTAVSNSCHTFGTLETSGSNSTLGHQNYEIHNSSSSPNLHSSRKLHNHNQGQSNSNPHTSHRPQDRNSSSKTGSYYDTMGDQHVPYHYSFYPSSVQSCQGQGHSPPTRNRNEFLNRAEMEKKLNMNFHHHPNTKYDKSLPPPFASVANMTSFQNGHSHPESHQNHHFSIPSSFSHLAAIKGYRPLSREGSSMAGYTSAASISCLERGSMDFCSCQESINSSVPSVTKCFQSGKTSVHPLPTTNIDCSNSNATDSSSSYPNQMNKTPPQQLKKLRTVRKTNRFEP